MLNYFLWFYLSFISQLSSCCRHPILDFRKASDDPRLPSGQIFVYCLAFSRVLFLSFFSPPSSSAGRRSFHFDLKRESIDDPPRVPCIFIFCWLVALAARSSSVRYNYMWFVQPPNTSAFILPRSVNPLTIPRACSFPFLLVGSLLVGSTCGLCSFLRLLARRSFYLNANPSTIASAFFLDYLHRAFVALVAPLLIVGSFIFRPTIPAFNSST